MRDTVDYKTLFQKADICIYSVTYCGFCQKVKSAAGKYSGASKSILEVDSESNENEIRKWLKATTHQRTFPYVFVKGEFVGGCDDFMSLVKSGKLDRLLDE